jgi:hypothetical protein
MKQSKKNYQWSDLAKKPSSLLIYLTLDRYARTTPMKRDEVIERIEKDYGIRLSPKTISENAAIYKALSEGDHPQMAFHHLGKNGYLLGASTSKFTFAQSASILDLYGAISAEVRSNALQQLKPYLSDEDYELLLKTSALFARKGKEAQEDPDPSPSNVKMIATAFSERRMIRFFHTYVDWRRDELIQETISLVPFKLFRQNGGYYVLGGQIPSGKEAGLSTPAFYVASLTNIQELKIGAVNKKTTPETCLGGNKIDLEDYIAKNHIIHEGLLPNFRPSIRPTFARIYGIAPLIQSRNLYGDKVRVVSSTTEPDSVGRLTKVFQVQLSFEPLEIVAWYFLFYPRVVLMHPSRWVGEQMSRRSLHFSEDPAINKWH